MMEFLKLLGIVQPFFPFGVIKLFILILLVLYLAFAFIIVQQEHLMSKVVEIPFSPFLRIITLIHFFAVIGVLLLSFFFL